MACDMPEPCKFPSLDSCQKRFLWAHKEVDLTPQTVVGFVLQVGDMEILPALGFESLDPFFFRVSKQGPCFTSIKEDGGDKRLVQLELACKADGVASPDPVQSGTIAAIAEAILMQIYAKQVPSLVKVAPIYLL